MVIVHSVDQISFSSLFLFLRVARVSRDYCVCGGRLSVYTEEEAVMILVDCDVKETDAIVGLFFYVLYETTAGLHTSTLI